MADARYGGARRGCARAFERTAAARARTLVRAEKWVFAAKSPDNSKGADKAGRATERAVKNPARQAETVVTEVRAAARHAAAVLNAAETTAAQVARAQEKADPAAAVAAAATQRKAAKAAAEAGAPAAKSARAPAPFSCGGSGGKVAGIRAWSGLGLEVPEPPAK